jgi:hypothetical protein
VGTDDGNVQVTRDDGKTWVNVVGKIPGVKKGAYVSRVVASKHNEGTAFATFDNHRSDDFSVYIYATADYGASWTRITNGIPQDAGTVHVVREHPRNANLLFAGTEFGLFVSFDRGSNWERMKNGLPTVPVDDIAIHPRENDLILATHGRSLWIMDDITPLEEMSDSITSADLHLFDTRPGIEWRLFNHKGFTGAKEFVAANPPYGVILDYYLKTKIEGHDPVKITIVDQAGNHVREIKAPGEAGINRIAWDLRYDAPAPPPPPPPGVEPGQGGGFGFGGGRGPTVDPGAYTVSVEAGGKTVSKTVTVEEDPRVTMTSEERAQRRQAIAKLYAMAKEADEGRRKIVALRTSLTALTDGWKKPGAPTAPENVKKAAGDLLSSVKEVVGTFEMEREGGLGNAGPPLKYTPPPVNQKITRLMFSIDGYAGAPTARQEADVDAASTELTAGLTAVHTLTGDDLSRLNKMMAEAGIPYVTAEPAPSETAGGRRGRP